MDKARLKQVAVAAIDAAAEELNDLSQDIWKHPELCFEEHYSHKTLTDYFDNKGLAVERGYVVDTGFRCQYGPAAVGPNIAVLCEYDALPEIGHACGHNLIAEVGTGAALGIQAVLDEATRLGQNLGKLTVLGTPAEEGGNGKELLIRGGALDSVDVAMMAHPGHLNTLVSPGDTCSVCLTVKFTGKESHAADTPWDGINALDAAFLAYGSISVLRQQMKPSWRVHGIITSGGVKPNIIPEKTVMEYFVRAPILKELDLLRGKITKCLHGAAEASDCKVELTWQDMPYLNVITNKSLGDLYMENIKSLGVDFDRQTDIPLAGSTDMGNVTHLVPGFHPIFYIGEPIAAHTKPFTVLSGSQKAQPYTLNQAKAIAMTAVDVYCQPQLVAEMKSQLQDDLAREA